MMSKSERVYFDLGLLLLAPILGIGAVIFGSFASVMPEEGSGTLVPAVRQGLEGLNLVTLVLLLVVGFGLGLLSRWNPVLLGLATVAPFPIIAIVEVAIDPTSHNLWPFEALLYSGMAVITVVGAFAGWGIWRLREPTPRSRM